MKKLNSLFGFLKESKSKDLSKKFVTVYRENQFKGKESISGPGSDLEQTKEIQEVLPGLLEKLKVKSFMDAPCGDYFWMRFVKLDGIKYIGVDIVPELVMENLKRFGDSHHDFLLKNIVKDDLPKVDLILCRDCLVHLNYAQAKKAIANFKASGAKYLLTTTFPGRINKDLGNIIWRPLDLCAAPFNFPAPLILINERCTEDDLEYTDKSLGLWELDKLFE